MLTIAFASLSFALLVACIVLYRLYRGTQATEYTFNQHHTPPRLAARWSNNALVQFSRQYHTLRNTEV